MKVCHSLKNLLENDTNSLLCKASRIDQPVKETATFCTKRRRKKKKKKKKEKRKKEKRRKEKEKGKRKKKKEKEKKKINKCCKGKFDEMWKKAAISLTDLGASRDDSHLK